VQTGPRSIEVTELDLPDQIAADQALLQVEACGVCGSDHDQYVGYYNDIGMAEYPCIPGHEMVGRLVDVGPQAAAKCGVSVGDRVAVEATVSCRICEMCRSGQGMLCPRKDFMYAFRPTTLESGLWGGYAEYMVIRPGTVMHRLSPELAPEDAVMFNPLSAGFEWAVKLAGTTVGDRVLVLGPGMRGLASVIAAREAGAQQIIVTGLAKDAHKLDLAKRFGATDVIDAESDDVVGRVRELTGGRMANRVIDTTPLAARPIIDSIDAAAPGGTVVWGGIKGERDLPGFSSDKVLYKGLRVIGAFGVNSWAVEQAVQLVNARKYDFSELHTHTLGLDGVETAMRLVGGELAGEDFVHITIVPNR
jgi:threonine dehydrogenase-like Zn-dependent dehydrogenase